MIRRKLVKIVTKLGALSKQHGLLKFVNSIAHASTLNGFVQDLDYAITDYQVQVTKSTASVVLCSG